MILEVGPWHIHTRHAPTYAYMHRHTHTTHMHALTHAHARARTGTHTCTHAHPSTPALARMRSRMPSKVSVAASLIHYISATSLSIQCGHCVLFKCLSLILPHLVHPADAIYAPLVSVFPYSSHSICRCMSILPASHRGPCAL